MKMKCISCFKRVPEKYITMSSSGPICERCKNEKKNIPVIVDPKTEIVVEKFCVRCETDKLLSEFGRYRGKLAYVKSWCKSCCNEYNRDYRQKNKAKNAAYMRRYRARKTRERQAKKSHTNIS